MRHGDCLGPRAMTPTARFRSPRTAVLAAFAAAGLLAAGCSSPAGRASAPRVAIEEPPIAEQAIDLHGLHNVVAYAPGMLCGSVPDGEQGLRTLAAMGTRTVISVDGAAPAVAAAAALGMRYVHLPIQYSGIEPARQRELAQAIANLEGPFYVHCHHGKHRSAAALGSALVLAGRLTPAQVVDRMKVSGTAADYRGLWQAVQQGAPLAAAELARDPASFPATHVVRGMVATMTEIDAVFDNVKLVRKADWTTPPDHPDLVPAKETRRLHALLAQLCDDAETKAHADDFRSKLDASIAAGRELDAAVQRGDRAAAEAKFAPLEQSCKACHKAWRDN